MVSRFCDPQTMTATTVLTYLLICAVLLRVMIWSAKSR